MAAKFSEALRLLWRHLGLFSAITLTIWLPGNILMEFVAYAFTKNSDANLLGSIRLSIWIEMIFGPIYVGALVYALYQIKSGHPVTYREAMAVGFKKWGSLFAARFVAGLITGLGFIALIVPGVILLVRYSLLDPVVVLEERKALTNPRERSTILTAGRRWQIFWSAVLFFLCFMIISFAISFAVNFPLALFGVQDLMPVDIATDCLSDIIYAVIQIVMFLFYWEATAHERATQQLASPPTEPPVPGISSEPVRM